jgi:hypothetical protein
VLTFLNILCEANDFKILKREFQRQIRTNQLETATRRSAEKSNFLSKSSSLEFVGFG